MTAVLEFCLGFILFAAMSTVLLLAFFVAISVFLHFMGIALSFIKITAFSTAFNAGATSSFVFMVGVCLLGILASVRQP